MRFVVVCIVVYGLLWYDMTRERVCMYENGYEINIFY